MACDPIAASIEKGCNSSNGGNSAFYPFEFIEEAFTIVDGVATGINATPPGGTPLTVAYSYYINGSDSNTFSAPLIGDNVTGTSVCTQTMAIQMKQVAGSKSFELTKAAQGCLSGVLKDRNGIYRIVAHENAFKTFTAEEISGGAATDFNGYNVTGVAETKILPPILDAATVTAFLALVV